MSTLHPAFTQPHNQWILGAHSPGVKQSRLGDVFLPHLVTRLRMRAAIMSILPVCPHGECKIPSFFFTWMYIKRKDKVHPRTCHESQDSEQRYSSTFSLTLGLDGAGWSMPCQGLANLLPGKRPGTHCTRGCMLPSASLDDCRKSRPPPGFNPLTTETLARCYTDYTILAG